MGEIGDRVRWLREWERLNVREMAQLLRYDTSTWRKIEAGKRDISKALAFALAARTRVPIGFILRGDLRGVRPDILADLAADPSHGLVLRPSGTDRGRDTDRDARTG